MKLYFVDTDSLITLKKNIENLVPRFAEASGEWIPEVLGKDPFIATKFAEIPDFQLEMSSDHPFFTEAKNAEIVYENLKFLSDSQATDERLWVAMCLRDFWRYTQYRWDITNGKCTESAIVQHFFFPYNIRRSLTRNAMSRLWWIGRLSYDKNHPEDPYRLTRFLCEHSDNIMNTLERNTSNNSMIIRAFLSACLDARDKEGLRMDTNIFAELAKYLNLLGGTYILDCLPEETIYQKIMTKARLITERKNAEETKEQEQAGKEMERPQSDTSERNKKRKKAIEKASKR